MPDPSARLDRIRHVRRRQSEAGPVARGEGDFELVALPADLCDVVRDALVAECATSVIEIGLAYGSSALAIGEALATSPDAKHLVIDAFQDHFGYVGRDVLVEAGMGGMTTLIEERSQHALPRLAADGVVVDATFVAGSHIFHNVFLDLTFLQELVRPGGLVILDDCNWPSVAMAVNYFSTNAGWSEQPGGRPPRLRAFRLPDPRREPRFEEFVPFGIETTQRFPRPG